jgi:hypothetical protein
MIQAFIDDSKSEGSPPLFVLGGYVATAETWAAFSTDWQAELDASPRLEYVKYIEAMGKRPTKQFYGQSREDARARIAKFRAIIEKYDLKAFAIGFRVDHLTETHAGLPKKWLNPYYSAVASLMPELARSLGNFGLPQERLDLVFDEQVMEKTQIFDAWQALRGATGKFDPPDILSHILTNSPRWDNDKDVLPLQAADMQATWYRMAFEATRDGRRPDPMPGSTKGLIQVSFILDLDFFKARAARLAGYVAAAKA